MPEDARSTLRLDKWLWRARFFKSRTLAARFCGEGKIRVNSARVPKSHFAVRAGDVLTFPSGPHIRVVMIRELGTRRGPAAEARALYEDLNPPRPRPKPENEPDTPAPAAEREPGAGRPTKRERRDLDKLRGG